jgi:hypothetical protein
VSDAGAPADSPPHPGPLRIAFHSACDQGDLEVADRLLRAVERMVLRPSLAGHTERRTDFQPLIAALERLWTLRQLEARDG